MQENEIIYVSEKTYNKIFKYLSSELLYAHVVKRSDKFDDLSSLNDAYVVVCESARDKAENALIKDGIDTEILSAVSESHFDHTAKEIRKLINRLRVNTN